jgi:uncharacterized protein
LVLRIHHERATAVAFAIGLLATSCAQAASFDCARANAPVERKICADSALSAADAALGASFDAALALSLDPADLRAEQLEWLRQSRDKAANEAELARSYADRQQAIDRILAQFRADQPARTISAAEGRAACLPVLAIADAGACTVSEFGELGAVEGHVFAYADYDYAKGAAQLDYRRVVVFERAASGVLRAIASPEPDAAFYYSKPQILHSEGRTALHIPAYESGTGNFNRERLFVWRDGRWRDADVSSWLSDLARRLPAGLNVSQGVFPDYAALTAETPLWRKNDGNACPSGGRAALALGWRGDRIALENIRLHKAAECGERLDARQNGK